MMLLDAPVFEWYLGILLDLFINGIFFKSWNLRHDDEAPVPESGDRILLDNFFDREPVRSVLSIEGAMDDDDTPLSEFLHKTIFLIMLNRASRSILVPSLR